MEMKHGRTSAYHPQCNAQAEVANKTKKCLKMFLPPLMFSYNTLFHRTIQTSPFFLTFGQNACQPFFNQEIVQSQLWKENTPEDKF
jgi:hypothetical protein